MQLRDRFYEHFSVKFLSAVTVLLLRKESFTICCLISL